MRWTMPRNTSVAKLSVFLIAAIAVILSLVAYYALSNQAPTSQQTSEITSSTNTCSTGGNASCITITSTNSSLPNGSSNACTHTISNGYCALPMSYAMLESTIHQNNTTFSSQNGTISIHVGYHSCIIEYYFLPNDTSVFVYLGVQNTTQTCE